MKFRRTTAILASGGMLISMGAPVSAPPRARPDIVLIVLDDTGFSDFGAYGSEIRIPSIDTLAARGVRYNRFDTKAVCSATRAALLTGRNSQTVRMADLPSRLNAPDPSDTSKDKGDIPTNAETVAQALKRSGYETFAIGKWHLTPYYEGGWGGLRARSRGDGQPQTSWPLQRGFQHFYGFLGGWTDQYRPNLVEDNRTIPTPAPADYHLSADLVDHAITDLDASAKKGKPAFLYLAFGATHTPIQVPQTYIDRYRGIYERVWDAIRAARFARMKALGVIPADTVLPARAPADAAWDSLDPQRKRVFARFMAAYAGFLEHTDEQIGRLVSHLKQTGALRQHADPRDVR